MVMINNPFSSNYYLNIQKTKAVGMNFNEDYKEEGQTLLKSFQLSLDRILQSQENTISYQLTYDIVYKLCKQSKQTDILESVQLSLHDKLQQQFRSFSLRKSQLGEGFFLDEVGKVLVKLVEITKRVCEVCLFLDVNYCQKEQNLSFARRLNASLFQAFSQQKQVIQESASQIFGMKVKGNCSECTKFMGIVDSIDEGHSFFEGFLVEPYAHTCAIHYQAVAEKAFKEMSLEEYLNWGRREIEDELTFLESIHPVKSSTSDAHNLVIKEVYSACVLTKKELIYEHEKQIFGEMTLPLLELLKYGRNKDVEGHVQWFMGRIEKGLGELDTNSNTGFIVEFCEYYNRVGGLLKNTHSKFDINYRSVFTFEEWINNEKFNIPLRLNYYIHQQLSADHSKQDFSLPDFLSHTLLIFKLVKEKNLFENIFRRLLINRLVENYLTYDLTNQNQLIQRMEEECGDEWVKKVKSICVEFEKSRKETVESRKLDCKDRDKQAGGLLPLLLDEVDWPYDLSQQKASINPQLLELTHKFEEQYRSKVKEQNLRWNPKMGSVVLLVRFTPSSRATFLMPTDMANVMLHFQDRNTFKIKDFVCETGYDLDEISGTIDKLSKMKVIECEGDEVSLNEGFKSSSDTVVSMFEEEQKLEVKAMEELKADRKLMVEAIIVKIMKVSKVIQKEDLMAQTAPLLAQRGFNFNSEFVQKSIDRLLDKEFLRDFEDGSLGYIA